MAYVTATPNLTEGFFVRMSKCFVDYRKYRLTLKELSALSIRELDDLGLAGADLDKIARDSVYAR